MRCLLVGGGKKCVMCPGWPFSSSIFFSLHDCHTSNIIRLDGAPPTMSNDELLWMKFKIHHRHVCLFCVQGRNLRRAPVSSNLALKFFWTDTVTIISYPALPCYGVRYRTTHALKNHHSIHL